MHELVNSHRKTARIQRVNKRVQSINTTKILICTGAADILTFRERKEKKNSQQYLSLSFKPAWQNMITLLKQAGVKVQTLPEVM